MTASPSEPTAATVFLRARRRLARYATYCVRRRFRGELSTEEALSVTDLALCRAWRTWQPQRGALFETYARPWVFGALLRAAEQERRHRILVSRLSRIGTTETTTLSPIGPPALDVRRALERLTVDEASVLVEHVVADVRLATLAKRRERHKSWATRRYRSAVARSRRRLTDRPRR